MRSPSDDELIPRLMSILTAAFNRSISSLEEAGAIDASKMRKAYRPGSKYYELVIEQLAHTATCGARGIRELFESEPLH